MLRDSENVQLMKRVLPLVLLLIFQMSDLIAQNRPGFFPEDIQGSNLQPIECLCKPGVYNDSPSKGLEISFQRTFGSTLEEEEGVLNPPLSEVGALDELELKLKIPLVLKEKFKLIAGWSYQPERYRFNLIGPSHTEVFQSIDKLTLRSNSFSLIANVPLDYRYYLLGRVRVLGNGDYGQFINLGKRYRVFGITGVFGIKVHDDFEWGIGVNYSTSFRNTSLLPFLVFNRNFNERWGLESIFPAMIQLRHNFRPGTIFSGGFKYNSRSYSLDIEEDDLSHVYNLNHSELRFELTWEQQLHPWVWLNVEGGLQYNFSTDFDTSSPGATPFRVEMGSVPYIRFGLFVSPPSI